MRIVRLIFGRFLVALLTLSIAFPAIAWKPVRPPPLFDVLMPKATAGDPNAQYSIGWHYLRGRSVPRNPAEALRWFLLAAEKDMALAKWAAGEIIFRGLAGDADRQKGLVLLQQAADAGVVIATYVIGDRYYELEQYGIAAQWLEKVAAKGHSAARTKLKHCEGKLLGGALP